MNNLIYLLVYVIYLTIVPHHGIFYTYRTCQIELRVIQRFFQVQNKIA